MKNQVCQNGYIALMSAIVISAVLIVITFVTSVTGFFVRFNVLDGEYKKSSSALAEACVDTVLLHLAKDPSDVTTGPVSIASGTCIVFSVSLNSPVAGQTTIETKAGVQKSVTNIRVVVDAANLSLMSWEEIPTL